MLTPSTTTGATLFALTVMSGQSTDITHVDRVTSCAGTTDTIVVRLGPD